MLIGFPKLCDILCFVPPHTAAHRCGNQSLLLDVAESCMLLTLPIVHHKQQRKANVRTHHALHAGLVFQQADNIHSACEPIKSGCLRWMLA